MGSTAIVGIVATLAGLTLAILTHIVIMARWSGQVDERLVQLLQQPARWTADLTATASAIRSDMSRMDAEVQSLRDWRHETEGKVERHDGAISNLNKHVFKNGDL